MGDLIPLPGPTLHWGQQTWDKLWCAHPSHSGPPGAPAFVGRGRRAVATWDHLLTSVQVGCWCRGQGRGQSHAS